MRKIKSKTPPIEAGANGSPNVDVDTGTRPSDLNARLSHAATLLDHYIAVTNAPADRDVAVAVDAFFLAQRPDAVLPADPVCAPWQRERGRTCYRDRDSENMSCSHPLASIVVALVKRDMGKDVPKIPHAGRWLNRGRTRRRGSHHCCNAEQRFVTATARRPPARRRRFGALAPSSR